MNTEFQGKTLVISGGTRKLGVGVRGWAGERYS